MHVYTCGHSVCRVGTRIGMFTTAHVYIPFNVLLPHPLTPIASSYNVHMYIIHVYTCTCTMYMVHVHGTYITHVYTCKLHALYTCTQYLYVEYNMHCRYWNCRVRTSACRSLCVRWRGSWVRLALEWSSFQKNWRVPPAQPRSRGRSPSRDSGNCRMSSPPLARRERPCWRGWFVWCVRVCVCVSVCLCVHAHVCGGGMLGSIG